MKSYRGIGCDKTYDFTLALGGGIKKFEHKKQDDGVLVIDCYGDYSMQDCFREIPRFAEDIILNFHLDTTRKELIMYQGKSIGVGFRIMFDVKRVDYPLLTQESDTSPCPTDESVTG